jgi:prophage regulatory protein
MPKGSEACVVIAAQPFSKMLRNAFFGILIMTSLPKTQGTCILLRRKQVELQTGLARSTIYKLIALGLFPAPVRLTSKAVAWPQNSINKWINSRISVSIKGDSHVK